MSDPTYYRTTTPDLLAPGDEIILTHSYGEILEVQIKGTVANIEKDHDIWWVRLQTHSGAVGAPWAAESFDDLEVMLSRKVNLPARHGVVILVDGEPFVFRGYRKAQGTPPWDGPNCFLSTAEVFDRGFTVLHTPEA